MKLTFFELKKALGTRILILFLLFSVIGNGLLCYSETQRDDTYFYLQEIEKDFADDPKAVRTYFEETLMPLSSDYERLLRAYIRGEISEEPIRSFPCSYSGDDRYNDYDLIRLFLSQQSTDEEWRKQIEKVVETAEINKEELLISYVNIDENSFAYRQQDMISRLYINVLNNTDSITKSGYGWDQFFSFDAANIFIFLLILAGAAVIFLADMGRPSLLLRVAKKGRGHTAVAKIVALLLWSVLSVILVLLTTGGAVFLKCGEYSDLFGSMASILDYQFMPYSFTVLEYLLVFVGTKLLLGWAVAMFCALICLLIRNVSLGFLASTVSVATSFLIFGVAQTDVVKYLNFYGIACFSQMTKEFRCVNVFRHPVLLLPAAIVLLILVFLFCTVAAFFLFRHSRLGGELRFRPFAWIGHIWKQVSTLPQKKRAPKPKNLGTSLLVFEFKKNFMTRTSIILLLIVLVLKIGTAANTYDFRSGYQRTLYKEYMNTLAGQNADEKREFIESEYSFVTEKINQFNSVRSDFLQGKVEPEAYNSFLVEYQYARDRIDLIEKIRKHSAYLDKTEENTGVAAHFTYDLDWIRLFQAGADTLLMVYLGYTFAGIFADEYGRSPGRVSPPTITRTTKNGRGKLFFQKMIFVVLSAILITGIFSVIDGALILRNFDLPDGNAPLLSLEIFGNASVSVSIREILLTSIIVKTVAALILSWISAMLGVLIKNKLYTLIASFFLAFLPEILFTFGVKPAAYFSFVNVFQVAEWLKIGASLKLFGDFGYILLFFLIGMTAALVLTSIAKKEYCK